MRCSFGSCPGKGRRWSIDVSEDKAKIDLQLERLDSVAILATRLEHSQPFDPDHPDKHVQALLDDCYSFLDPVGVQTRIAQEQPLREELEELEVNKLGYMLVFALKTFDHHTRFLAEDFRHACRCIRTGCMGSMHEHTKEIGNSAYEKSTSRIQSRHAAGKSNCLKKSC